MKKTLTLILTAMILVAGLFILTGCNNNNSSKNPIVGQWQYKDYSSYVYTFNEDGTGEYAGKKFTYKTEGNNISITYEGTTAAFNSTFEIKDNQLIIKDSLGKDTVYNKK
jgi:uncharacterized lipoprotein NlpE involved in copper resistance